MYVDSCLHCPGTLQCMGNRRLQVLKADKCVVAMTYQARTQLWLLGRQVLLFRKQSRIVLFIKEIIGWHMGWWVGSVAINEETWVLVLPLPVFAEHLHPLAVLGAAREGVDDQPVTVTVWECKLPGFCRYLFRYFDDFKCRESPANAESRNHCSIAKTIILTRICFVVWSPSWVVEAMVGENKSRCQILISVY